MKEELEIRSLDELFSTHSPYIYFMRISGGNEKLGISDNDIAIVDKSRNPENDSVVVAILNGSFAIRRYNLTGEGVELYKGSDVPSEVFISNSPEIWGVVVGSVTQYKTFR